MANKIKFLPNKPAEWTRFDYKLHKKDKNIFYCNISEEIESFYPDLEKGIFENFFADFAKDKEDLVLVTELAEGSIIRGATYLISRIKSSQFHCDYAPAIEWVRYYGPSPINNPNVSKKYCLYSKELNRTAFNIAKKKGIEAVRETRIKINGTVSVGEELEFAGNGNGILWVRNGEELWVLDFPYRSVNTRYDSSLINDQRKLMGIDEKDKTRFFLTDAQTLENMVGESLLSVMKSTTAS
jgi:hypothetical protein